MRGQGIEGKYVKHKVYPALKDRDYIVMLVHCVGDGLGALFNT